MIFDVFDGRPLFLQRRCWEDLCSLSLYDGRAPKERRRRRAEKRSSKTRKWTAQFSDVILRLSGVLRANLRGQRRNGLSKNTFWTTVSLHDAFPAPLARSNHNEGGKVQPSTR